MTPEANRIAATLLIEEVMPRLRKHQIPVDSSPITGALVAICAACKKEDLMTTRQIRQIFDELVSG